MPHQPPAAHPPRLAAAIALSATLAAFAGCSQNTADDDATPDIAERHAMNVFAVHDYYDEHISAAVVREHTLYPHHFVDQAGQLNQLGRRDLAIFARHDRHEAAPPLNLRRGDENEAIYDARVRAVTDHLESLGVPPDRIEVTDGFPGGDGVSGPRSILILLRDFERAAEGPEPLTPTTTETDITTVN